MFNPLKIFRRGGNPGDPNYKPPPDPGRKRIRLDFMPENIYAIGDVHGCFDFQVQLEQKIIEDGIELSGEKLIIYLGDLVDRGENSAAVIEHCQTPLPDGFKRICICGNHDQAFLEFVENPKMTSEWMQFGGDKTLGSYGLDVEHFKSLKLGAKDFAELVQQSIPPYHVQFLREMPVALVTPKVIFVHAGMRPGLAFDKHTDEDFMWVRQEFLIEKRATDKIIVHGHTPSDKPILGPGRVGIDTGAYAGGTLTALKLVPGKIEFLEVG